jgi:hypothetical protein
MTRHSGLIAVTVAIVVLWVTLGGLETARYPIPRLLRYLLWTIVAGTWFMLASSYCNMWTLCCEYLIFPC